jgi:hypothetical protein
VLGGGLAGLWGLARRGGRYGLPPVATALTPAGVALYPSPTYRIRQVVVTSYGSGYTRPFSSFTINVGSDQAATFTTDYGLAAINLASCGNDYSSTPPLVSLTPTNLSGATAVAVMKPDGLGYTIDYFLVTAGTQLTPGLPSSVTVSVPPDGSGTACVATAVVGPLLGLVDGGRGYRAFPTDAQVIKANSGPGTGFQVRFEVEVDGLLLDHPNLDDPLPVELSRNPGDAIPASPTNDALLFSGLRLASPPTAAWTTTFADGLTEALSGSLLKYSGQKGLLVAVVEDLWAGSDWRDAAMPLRPPGAGSSAKDACLSALRTLAQRQPVNISYGPDFPRTAQYDNAAVPGTTPVSDVFGDLLAQVQLVLWRFSDKFKPDDWYYLERGLEDPTQTQYVAFAQYILNRYDAQPDTLSLTERRALLRQAFEQVAAGHGKALRQQVKGTVLSLNSRWAYHETTLAELTVNDVQARWSTDSRAYTRPAWLELLVEVLGNLVPTACSDRLFGVGLLADSSIHHFRLRLGAWQLVRRANNATQKLVFAVPLTGGLLCFGDRVVAVAATHQVAALVQLSLPAVKRTQRTFAVLSAGDLELLEVQNLAALPLTTSEAGLVRSFLAGTVAQQLSTVPATYLASRYPFDYSFAYRSPLAALNVLADIPTQHLNQVGGERSWLTPTSYFYYVNPRYDDEAGGGELSICLSMGEQPSTDDPDLHTSLVPVGSRAAFYLAPRLVLQHLFLPSLAKWFYLDSKLQNHATAQDFELDGSSIRQKTTLYCPNFLTNYQQNGANVQPTLKLNSAEESGGPGFTLTLNAENVELNFKDVGLQTPNQKIAGTASRTIRGRYVAVPQADGSTAFSLQFTDDRYSQPFLSLNNATTFLQENLVPVISGATLLVLNTVLWYTGRVLRQRFANGALANPPARLNQVMPLVGRAVGQAANQVGQAALMVYQYMGQYLWQLLPDADSTLLLNHDLPGDEPEEGLFVGANPAWRDYRLLNLYRRGEAIVLQVQLTDVANGQQEMRYFRLNFGVVRDAYLQTLRWCSRGGGGVIRRRQDQTLAAQRQQEILLQRATAALNALLINRYNAYLGRCQKYWTIGVNIVLGGLTVGSTLYNYFTDQKEESDLQKYLDAALRNQFATTGATLLNDIKPFQAQGLVPNNVRLQGGLVVGFDFARQGLAGVAIAGQPWQQAIAAPNRLQTLALATSGRYPLRVQLARATGSGYTLLGTSQQAWPTADATTWALAAFGSAPGANLLVISLEHGLAGNTQPFTLTLTRH